MNLSKNNSCSCENGCLNMMCQCFKQGGICSTDCKCKNCQNKNASSIERIEAVELLLKENPLSFTGINTLDEDDISLIGSFTTLERSIDTTPFKAEINNKNSDSKLGNEEVHIKLAQTLVCRAGKCIETKDKTESEERIEQEIAEEFENCLNLILTHLPKKE